jgi:pimeloyl-ACP methyl ester carboxylesterase
MGTHELKHEMAQIEPDVRLHFAHAGEGARTVVLLHGFPQTWWAWRSTIPALAAAGFHVIAPDYRDCNDRAPVSDWFLLSTPATAGSNRARVEKTRRAFFPLKLRPP